MATTRLPMTCVRCGITRMVTQKYYRQVERKESPPICRSCRQQLWMQAYQQQGPALFKNRKKEINTEIDAPTITVPCGKIREYGYGRLRCRKGDECCHYMDCLDVCAAKQWQGWREVDGSDAALSKHISGETCDFELPNGGAAQSGESDVSSAS